MPPDPRLLLHLTRRPRPTSAGPMDALDILVLVLSGVPVEDLKPKDRGC